MRSHWRVQSAELWAVEILYLCSVAEEVPLVELRLRGLMIRWGLDRETALDKC
jgi:hypothetical protein